MLILEFDCSFGPCVGYNRSDIYIYMHFLISNTSFNEAQVIKCP